MSLHYLSDAKTRKEYSCPAVHSEVLNSRQRFLVWEKFKVLKELSGALGKLVCLFHPRFL